MLWRHLCLVRARSAAGLLGLTLLVPATAARAQAPAAPAAVEPAPVVAAPAADDSSRRPVPVVSETVSVLDARKSGELAVELRGAGQSQVRMTLKNTTGKRLSVVLPPGLVASSAAAQGRGGGGFQSMGLGSITNRPGAFGAFRGDDAGGPGFRSVGVTEKANAVVVPAGQSVELAVPSVCLNFGIPTPTFRDKFELVDVEDYSTDPRVRKALRSLATYGTSQGVAQAVMWRVCNDVPFALMARQATKVMNSHEIALASRFVEAVDASGSAELVDPAYLQEGRLFVKVTGEGTLARDAERLAREVDGQRLLGLPARAADADAARAVAAPALLLNVVLTSSQTGETRGRVVLSQVDADGHWAPIGKTSFSDHSTASVLDGPGLARAVERAVASTYVSVKPAGRGQGTTTFRVDNRLPFTLSKVMVKTGTSSGAPSVELTGLGIAPARSGQVTVPAPTATVERVEFNGL